MRFFLDHNVPVSVRKMLHDGGHECWTAADAGLATEGQDDNLSVYATEHHAVLVTMDVEFTRRRRRNPIGHHVMLRCAPPEAAAVLGAHLTEVLDLLHRADVTIAVSQGRVIPASRWE